MQARPKQRLFWHGRETIEAAKRSLQAQDSMAIEIELPADFHHTVYRHVRPEAGPGEPEEVDISGGTELLERIAEIRSLGLFRDLVEPASQAGVAVRVRSPVPHVILTFPQEVSAF